ncbi:MAG: tyrosine-type recombinase/integrase [Rhodomicrobium sp.]
MSIRKRTLPSGAIRWLCGYMDGAGVRRGRLFKTKREAVDFQITAGGEVRAGTHVADAASITIEKAGELWLQRCQLDGLEASTIRQYGQHLQHHILPLIGIVRLSRLSKPAIEEFRDRLLETRSRALTKKVLVSLKSLLSEAQRRGLVAQNAATGTKVTIAKRHEEKVAIPSREEIRAIINETAGLWPLTLPWRALILVGLFCGLRASEIRSLAWDHVSFEEKLLRIRQRADFKNKMGSPKSAAGTRDVPLAPIVLNALRQWRLVCPASAQNLVFPTRAGTIISNSNMHRQCWRPLLRAAGLDGRYRFHDLRHACASMLIEAGWQAKKVQTVMGHGSVQMTFDLYGHLWKTPQDDADAMAQIEKRLFA